MKQNWDFNFTIRISADEVDQAEAILKEVATQIRDGKPHDDGNYCAGTYEYVETEQHAGRPATQIEVEAMGAICNLQDDIAGLQDQIVAFREILRQIEYSSEGCCPICGGSRDNHDTTCVLGALLHPGRREKFEEMAGGASVWNRLKFDAFNRPRFR